MSRTDQQFPYLFHVFAEVTCAEPLLPPNATIVSNNLTKYLEDAVVSCANGTTIEIKCQTNGTWHPDETTICGT